MVTKTTLSNSGKCLSSNDPHKDCELHYAGVPLEQTQIVVLAFHGRYGAAGDILKLAEQSNCETVAWIAPEARDSSWWGASFLAPLSQNEPGLTSALDRLTAITDDLAKAGFGPERIVLTGFSQGACLVLEHVARHPKPWRGVVAMSGGLLGTSEGDGVPCSELNGYAPKVFDYECDLAGLPIHIGCHREDPVIPIARVTQSAGVLQGLGAKVSLKTHPGNMHGVLPSDLDAIRSFARV